MERGRQMAYGVLNEEAIRQNLADAGCPASFVEAVLHLWATGTTEEQLCLLCQQRCRLLDEVRIAQQKLDCLDYLRYALQKQAKAQKRCRGESRNGNEESCKGGRTHETEQKE